MGECTFKACGCKAPPVVTTAPAPTIPGGMRTTLAIAKMDCPTEEALIRNKLGGMPGVGALDFNLMQRTLTVTHAPEALEAAITAIRSLGMEAVLAQEGKAGEAAAPEKSPWWPLAQIGRAHV